jgi:hypothetical protein
MASEDVAPQVIWGAEAIAKIINRTPRQTFALLDAGLLPAKKIGGRWMATRENLIAFLSEAA